MVRAPLLMQGSLSEVRCISRGHHAPKSEHTWWQADHTRSFGKVDRFYPSPLADMDHPLGCGFVMSRDVFQDQLKELNPTWKQYVQEARGVSNPNIQMNPDGDVQLDNIDYQKFQYPACPSCGGILKPDVVLFGENVRRSVRMDADCHVAEADAILLIGTTLATHSAYKLAREASEVGKPVVLVNRGPTRVDAIADSILDINCSDVLNRVANEL